MSNNNNNSFSYTKALSSLFCSVSIVLLSILSLLNNLSLDMYSMFFLLKTVLPAAFCFWFLGFSIGKILDSLADKVDSGDIEKSNKAYNLPSMFSASDELAEQTENLEV